MLRMRPSPAAAVALAFSTLVQTALILDLLLSTATQDITQLSVAAGESPIAGSNKVEGRSRPSPAPAMAAVIQTFASNPNLASASS